MLYGPSLVLSLHKWLTIFIAQTSYWLCVVFIKIIVLYVLVGVENVFVEST